MPIKQFLVLVLIDDLSSISVALYDNVTLYDYGIWNRFRKWGFGADGGVDYYKNLANYIAKTFLSVHDNTTAGWSIGYGRDYARNLVSVDEHPYVDYGYFLASRHSPDG